MLILVAVTLDISIGENGLVNKAKTASEATTKAMEQEMLLTAAIGAMVNDGTVNFTVLNSNLPEGFTGSNGSYTSKNGNTFTVAANGEISYIEESNNDEIETIDLNGRYYFDFSEEIGSRYIEIENHNKLRSYIYYSDDEVYEGEHDVTLAINETNKTVSMQSEALGDETEIYTYDFVIDDNKVVNKILFYYDMIYFQNMNGVEFPLEGTYISEIGETITFGGDNEYDFEYYYNASGVYGHYAVINGRGYFDGEFFTISEDLNTVTYKGTTYTKQTTTQSNP